MKKHKVLLKGKWSTLTTSDEKVPYEQKARDHIARQCVISKRVTKGDCLLTDCNVTGTGTGTPDKPKFALRSLWEYGLLPSLDALVAEGGL